MVTYHLNWLISIFLFPYSRAPENSGIRLPQNEPSTQPNDLFPYPRAVKRSISLNALWLTFLADRIGWWRKRGRDFSGETYSPPAGCAFAKMCHRNIIVQKRTTWCTAMLKSNRQNITKSLISNYMCTFRKVEIYCYIKFLVKYYCVNNLLVS